MHPFFHPLLDREESEFALAEKDSGTWLIRDSHNSRAGKFILSVKEEDKVTHNILKISEDAEVLCYFPFSKEPIVSDSIDKLAANAPTYLRGGLVFTRKGTMQREKRMLKIEKEVKESFKQIVEAETKTLQNILTSDKAGQVTLGSQLREKWAQSVTVLPVAIDFPRLFSKIQIEDKRADADEDNARLTRRNASRHLKINASRRMQMLKVLGDLADTLGATASRSVIDSLVVHEDDDLSLASQDVARVVMEDEILGNLLKAINQSIIAVPFVFLKSKIPFKDVSNFWDIVVELEDECVTVYHTKQGNATENDFTFTWQLVLQFNPQITELKKAELTLSKLKFAEEIRGFRKKQVKSLFADVSQESFLLGN